MTTVDYSEEGGVLRFRADGHAAWAEDGTDLVCAAASMLAYTLLQCLRDAEEQGWLEELDTDIWDGGALAEAVPVPGRERETALLFRTALTGYRLLAAEYPDNVRVEETRKMRGETERENV